MYELVVSSITFWENHGPWIAEEGWLGFVVLGFGVGGPVLIAFMGIEWE